MVNRLDEWSPMGWIYSVPGTSVQMVASHKQTNLCIEEPIQSIQIIKFTDCSWCPICVSLRPLCVGLVPVRVQHKCMGTQEFVWSDCFAQSRAFDMIITKCMGAQEFVWSDCFAQSRAFDMIIFCKMTSYIRKKEKECMLFSPFFPSRIRLIWNNLRTRFDLKTNWTVLGTPLFWLAVVSKQRLLDCRE